VGVVQDRLASIALGWNDSQCPFVGNLLSDIAAAIGFVCNDGERWNVPIQKRIHHLTIV